MRARSSTPTSPRSARSWPPSSPTERGAASSKSTTQRPLRGLSSSRRRGSTTRCMPRAGPSRGSTAPSTTSSRCCCGGCGRGRRPVRLPVLFTFNSTGYFVYRGETMGYEYELLNLFAKETGLRLEPVVVRDSRVLFEKLNHGDGDVVAAQLAASPGEHEVLMTDSLYET